MSSPSMEIVGSEIPTAVSSRATKRVLIIEDDRLLARIYWRKLSLEGYSANLATDGVRGLELVQAEKPDLVVLDLMLPRMNGVDVLRSLRQDPATHHLPVIVFTNVYLGDWAEQAREAGATRMLSKSQDSPDKLLREIQSLIGKSQSPTFVPATEQTAAPAPELRQNFLNAAPQLTKELQEMLNAFLLRGSGDLSRVVELEQKVKLLAAQAAVDGFPLIAHMATTLDALLKDLSDRPQAITPSARQTITDGVMCLTALFALAEQPAECSFSRLNVLAVDDDPVSLRLITYALGRLRLRTQCVEKPVFARQLLIETTFDLILLDIEMPELTGPQLCAELRQWPANVHTPVIFVTGVKEFDRRQDAIAHGADDLIAKPFLSTELGVKALTRLLTARG